MSDISPESVNTASGLDRRRFLQYAGSSAAVLGGGSLLAGATASTASASSSKTGTPKKGGTLRIGVAGGSTSDTLDAQSAVEAVDNARVNNLFEPLVWWDLNMQLQMVLAESMEPQDGGKVWIVKIRPGVEFHSGKKLTAQDVIFSLNRIITNKLSGIFALSPIDAPKMKALDSHTVRIPMKEVYPLFPEFYASLWQNLMIVPTGYKPSKPDGTGPFKYKSFTPGQQSTFVRNPNYWQSGGPYVDTLIITDYADENGQVNALLSNQVDAISLLSYASLARLKSGGAKSAIARTGLFTPIEMNTTIAPFTDVRVRQAMRLVVNRSQMLDVVFGGNGRIGNDLSSPLDPEYDHALPQRVQDVEKAKSLLKAAGHEKLTVTLNTAPIYPGVTSMAQIFAQQAKAAGITVNLNTTTSAVLDGPNYGKWAFATSSFWLTTPYLPWVAQGTLNTAPYNVTHFNNTQYNKLYAQAFKTSNTKLQTELAHEMQVIDYNTSGYVIPYFLPTIDGLANNVEGTQPGEYGMSFGNWTFRTMWLS